MCLAEAEDLEDLRGPETCRELFTFAESGQKCQRRPSRSSAKKRQYGNIVHLYSATWHSVFLINRACSLLLASQTVEDDNDMHCSIPAQGRANVLIDTLTSCRAKYLI